MRNSVLMVASGLVVVIAGLVLYQGFVQRDEQKQLLSEVRTQNESTRRELDRLSSEQAVIRKTVTQTHDAVAAVTDTSNVAIRTDFASVSGSMRTAIAEYYLTNMRLPASNEEVGLPAPERYRGASLQSATVMPDGHVELLFGATSGKDGGRIRLVPDISGADAMGVRWHCETGDFASIAQALPGCDYKPAGAQPSGETQPETHISAKES
jgi:hypothetical protein